MKERPESFPGPMVKALLEGRKTQTRRAIGLQTNDNTVEGSNPFVPIESIEERILLTGNVSFWLYRHKRVKAQGIRKIAIKEVKCPFGSIGDRLWVRETFVLESEVESEQPPPFNDGRPIKRPSDTDFAASYVWLQPHYRATDPEPELSCERPKCERDEPHCHWSSPIHMPRWASRIALEIVNIRVERVQEITEGDAEKEGVSSKDQTHWPDGDPGYMHNVRRRNFVALWDSLNAKRGYGWDKNPWVWVIEFKVR